MRLAYYWKDIQDAKANEASSRFIKQDDIFKMHEKVKMTEQFGSISTTLVETLNLKTT